MGGKAEKAALVLACLVSLYGTGRAEQGPDGRLDSEEISGLVLDRTVTLLGRRFYEGFVSSWSGNGDANLFVYEKPSARWGSILWVEYKDERIYRTVLHPGRADPDTKGQSGAEIVRKRVEQSKMEHLFRNNPDLAGDEV